MSSILSLWTDSFTINFGSRKTQHICSVISHGSGADLWESPLVCLVKEIGSEERRRGRRSVTSPSSTTSAVSTADRGATDKRSHAGHERDGGDDPRSTNRRESIGTIQFLVKDKESMTTKRAFTMLLHYSGKVEEDKTWRFQLIQFLSQEPYVVEFLEWIENDLDFENQHSTAVQEKNLEHENAEGDVCADHLTPQEKKEKMKLV